MAVQAEKILSRRTTVGNISMWGTLHVSRPGGKVLGWLVDTWTEKGVEPHLLPRMHWVPRVDGKFYRVYLTVDARSSMTIAEEDTEIESYRAAFITATIGTWEQEWLNEQVK